MNGTWQKNKEISRFFTAIGIGCGVGALICCLLLLVAAMVFVSREFLPHAALGGITLTAAVIGSFFSGFISTRILGHMGLVAGFASAALLLCLMLVAGLFFSCSQAEIAFIITKISAILLAGSLGGVVAAGKKQKIHRRK